MKTRMHPERISLAVDVKGNSPVERVERAAVRTRGSTFGVAARLWVVASLLALVAPRVESAQVGEEPTRSRSEPGSEPKPESGPDGESLSDRKRSSGDSPSGMLLAQSEGGTVTRDRINPSAIELEAHLRGIRRGLNYVVRRAQGGDGSLSKRFSVAVTALGGMAMIGYGVEYNRGPYGKQLARCVDFLMDRQRPDGYFEDAQTASASKMHGHAYAVLFLAQVVGQIPLKQKSDEVREAIRSGVRTIESSQTSDGGWGYNAKSSEEDEGSITVCCLQALRAARDAGFLVSSRVIDRALWYLRSSAKTDGSFRYSLRGSSKSTYELTAAAVSTLDAAGDYSAPIHRRGVDFMKGLMQKTRDPFGAAQNFPYYGNLYAAQVYYQIGGETWELYARGAYPRLLKLQNTYGSWEDSRHGDVYATICAMLILELPLGYLPIFER